MRHWQPLFLFLLALLVTPLFLHSRDVSAQTPAPPSVPELLTPTNDMAIMQNDPAIGCPADARTGYGFHISFDWTDATSSVGIAGYDIVAEFATGTSPIVNRTVVDSEFNVVSCRSFVIDRNLTGWRWRVRARDTDGNVSEWSTYGTFTYAPCRISGAPCLAALPAATPTVQPPSTPTAQHAVVTATPQPTPAALPSTGTGGGRGRGTYSLWLVVLMSTGAVGVLSALGLRRLRL